MALLGVGLDGTAGAEAVSLPPPTKFKHTAAREHAFALKRIEQRAVRSVVVAGTWVGSAHRGLSRVRVEPAVRRARARSRG
jgi:hypothetical protein